MTNISMVFIALDKEEQMVDNQLNRTTFDDYCTCDQAGENKDSCWASDFMLMLDYPNMASFTKVIHRAMQSCLSTGIDPNDDFVRHSRVVDGLAGNDYRLSRFACYMVAMNGDIKKSQVAMAQVYFAKMTQQIELISDGPDAVERINTRHEIKEGHKSLSAVAQSKGVTDFAMFHDADYRGMYNMGVKKLAAKRGIEQKDIYDHMGKAELSANLFRLNMTEEKLKVRRITHFRDANNVHQEVGAGVRKMVYQSTGKNPEQLPVERKLNGIQKELKKANKELNKPRK